MRVSLLVTVAALIAAPTLAAAQPSTAPLVPVPAEPPPPDDYRELDPTTALTLSLGVTAAGYGAVIAAANGDGDNNALATIGAIGVIAGPSAGHWYQEDVWTRGFGLRLAGVVAVSAGVVSSIDICFEDCSEEDHAGAEMLIKLGLAAFAIGTVDDIISAPLAASRRNREHRERTIKSVSLAPQMNGDRVGLALAGTF